MKNFTRKASGNEQGSVLLAVLTIMTFASILAATALTFVSTASDRSFDNINDKQSYYTASTCLETFIESVLSPDSTNLNAFIEIANQGGGTSTPIEITGMGSCTISVEKPAGLEYIKVVSTATVNGQENSVACYLRPITEPSETTFKNAVELTGDLSAGYNNINVLGGMAGSNDDNSDKVYAFTNSSTISGQFFQYGSIVVKVTPTFTSGTRGEGVSMTATKNIYFAQNVINIKTNIAKKNDNKDNFIFANGALISSVNDLNIGSASTTLNDGIRPNDIDVFSHGMVIALKNVGDASTTYSKNISSEMSALSSADPAHVPFTTIDSGCRYKQYGNIYCFSGGETNSVDATTGLSNTDGKLAGNMVLEKGAQLTVYGDVYVSGDLYMGSGSSLKIAGNLYVSGEIKGDLAGLSVIAEEKSDLDANVRRTAGTTGFIYCTAFAKTEACQKNDVFKAQTTELDNAIYAGFATGRGKEPSNTYEGTKFVFDAEDLLVSDNKNISTISDKYKAICKDKGEKIYGLEQYKVEGDNRKYENEEYDYIITGDCYIDGLDGKKVLVKVTSTDVVIVFKNEAWLTNGCKFIVENKTKNLENDKSNSPSFCYFTVDTYTDDAKVVINYKTDDEGNYILDSKGEKIVTGSTHSGFVQNATLNMTSTTYFVDYDTWKNADIGNGNNGKPFNLTENTIKTAYTPTNGLGYIIMLLTEGTTINSSNQTLLEMTVYGRQATLNINNGVNVKYERGVESLSMVETKEVVVMGSAVVGTLKTSNQCWIAYYPPSSKSNLANLGSEAASDIVGYEVLKYTQKIG